MINRQAKSLFKNERVRRLLSEQNCLRAIPTSFVATYGLPPPPTLHSLIVLLHKFLSQVLKSAISCARTPSFCTEWRVAGFVVALETVSMHVIRAV